tara:strand:- start:1050 stop:2168 length:1119 start_codon:yes stop_codon:yes gene_type:complete
MKKDQAKKTKEKPVVRKEIEEMIPYSAPLEGRRSFLRLDFNENTVGPSPKVVKALHNISAKEISIYPEYGGLSKAVIENINSKKIINPFDSNQIGIFNGVDAAINAIFHSFGDKEDYCLTTSPTFGYYNPCAQMRGMKLIEIPYKTEKFEYPTNEIKRILVEKNPKLLLICNPNNPTGTVISPRLIKKFSLLSPKTLIVIDELYEAFYGNSIIKELDSNKNPNIVVLKSLSKIEGLAGLRIGFAIGNPEIIERIKRVTGPYDINTLAVKAAFAALDDQEYTNQYILDVKAARKWIKGKLLDNNIDSHFGGGNYFLIWPKCGYKIVESSLKNSNILVRSMNNKPLLSGSLRISIGTTKQMKRLWEALSSINNL